MRKIIYFLLATALTACSIGEHKKPGNKLIEQTELSNEKMKMHLFLDCMYRDPYFPKFLVDKCRNVLLELCVEIEADKPDSIEELYKLTQHTTDKLNDLQHEFSINNSEIETGARECLARDFECIAKAYGFDADIEELISNREW